MANAILELFPTKRSMTFPMKDSLMTLSFFRSCELRRKYTCHPALDNLANENSLPDNIALDSIKSRDERVTTKDAAPNSNTVAAAALGVDLQLTPQRGHSMCRSPW